MSNEYQNLKAKTKNKKYLKKRRLFLFYQIDCNI